MRARVLSVEPCGAVWHERGGTLFGANIGTTCDATCEESMCGMASVAGKRRAGAGVARVGKAKACPGEMWVR